MVVKWWRYEVDDRTWYGDGRALTFYKITKTWWSGKWKAISTIKHPTMPKTATFDTIEEAKAWIEEFDSTWKAPPNLRRICEDEHAR